MQVPYIDNVGTDATGETVMVYRLLSDPAEPRVPADEPRRACTSRYNGVTIMATKRMSQQLAGCHLAGAVEGGRPARLERAVHADRPAQSSQAGTFGRDAAGPNDFVNTDGR